MSEPAESPNTEVRIDREMGELAADLMRETAAADVLSAMREYEATGHYQTGISSLALENMETAGVRRLIEAFYTGVHSRWRKVREQRCYLPPHPAKIDRTLARPSR